MKKELHLAKDRGHVDYGWLKSDFSFSFAEYYAPTRMGFGVLRVINDDTIDPSSGFDTHSHANMEIITIVTSGELSHKDSTGASYSVKKNDVQVMSAGTGVAHSEYNNSEKEKVKLFQIWILPNKKNVIPRYDQKNFSEKDLDNKLCRVVSSKKSTSSLFIHQDASISLGNFKKNENITYSLSKNKGAFILLISGEITVENSKLNSRDAIAISETSSIKIKIDENSSVLIIEVPMQ